MKKSLFALLISAFLLTGCGRAEAYLETLPEYEDADEDTETAPLEADREDGGDVFVYVCGEVQSPGVYELAPGSRIYEAVALAGGLTAEADAAAVNQAELLTDGMKIEIPVYREAAAGTESVPDDRVNLNTATAEELMLLPGIGEAKAEAILSYREEHGPFQDIGELMNIPGIKEGVFSKLKEKIRT